jgi:putative ABC transport system substrate-binding protein
MAESSAYPIPKELAEAFAHAVLAFELWHPQHEGQQITSIPGRDYESIDAVCGLVDKFTDPLPQHVFYETVRAGGLVSLGPDIPAMAQQGAVYIDKIIHGAKPADLPVQQPAKYQLTINLKTAKALGLTVSQSLLAGADEVIE